MFLSFINTYSTLNMNFQEYFYFNLKVHKETLKQRNSEFSKERFYGDR